MTDITTPGEINCAVDNKSTAHAISKAGGHNGYVVDGVDIAQFYPEVNTANLNGFAHASSTGLDVILDGGEAFVAGWLCRDRQTTVSLPASSTTTVSVGVNPESTLATGEAPTDNDNIILDVAGEFTNGAPKLDLYEVETTATSISTVTDNRPLSRGEADGPWLSEDTTIDTVNGRFTITSSTYQDHLRIERSGVDNWGITPTSGHNGALEIHQHTGAGATYNLTSDGHIHIEDPDGMYAVESDEPLNIQISSTEPSSYDIWFEVE